MSVIIPNAFTQYELTPEEELEGAILTVAQIYWIQNQLSYCAQESIANVHDPKNPLESIQVEARCKGQMEAYQFILDSSAAAVDARMAILVPVEV